MHRISRVTRDLLRVAEEADSSAAANRAEQAANLFKLSCKRAEIVGVCAEGHCNAVAVIVIPLVCGHVNLHR